MARQKKNKSSPKKSTPEPTTPIEPEILEVEPEIDSDVEMDCEQVAEFEVPEELIKNAKPFDEIMNDLNDTKVKYDEKSILDKYGDADLEKLSDFTLKNGKCANMKFKQALNYKPEYCKWILTNKMNNRSTLALFKRYLERMIEYHNNNAQE